MSKNDIRFVTPSEFEEILHVVEKAKPAPPQVRGERGRFVGSGEDRRRAPFPEWFAPVLRTLMATGARPSEIVGTRGRVGLDPEEALDGGRVSYCKPHHGLRARDVLPNHRLALEGKHTTPKGRTEDLKARIVLCANDGVYGFLRARAERTMETHGPDARLFLAEARNGIEALRDQTRKLQRRLPAKWANFSPRWLRHSHAIAAIRAGIDLVSIQRQLGHENLATTAIYLRFAGMDERRYLAAFGGVGAQEEKRDCPSCGFAWTENAKTGALTLDARMGAAFRRRVVA